MSILKADSISFSYKQVSGLHPVLDNLSLSIYRGEFLSIIGPSGCGKSTLLRLLSGFIQTDSGVISRNGLAVLHPEQDGQMIFQDFNQLFPWLTVEQNILFPRHHSLFPVRTAAISEDDREKLEVLLEQTGLAAYRQFLPHHLSGGLKQRAALARALFVDPQILLMDEPFGSLDAPSRKELQHLLLRLWEDRHKTVLFVTHDISEALLLADRLLVFENEKEQFYLHNNTLPRPRDKHSDLFRKRKLELYSLIDPD